MPAPDLKAQIIAELKKDSKRVKALHRRYVLVHLTDEQYDYLESQRQTYRKGKGWFVRRLIVIDMVRRKAKDNGNS